jgi:sphingomyelin phosphodiesterase acid-like 3
MPLRAFQPTQVCTAQLREASMHKTNSGNGAYLAALGGTALRWLLVVAMVSTSAFAAPQRSSNNKFLIVSDLHFNPMADPTLVSELAAANPAQWEAILNRSKSAAFSQYGEDTNWWLLKSALDAMRTTTPHPALILVTGDLLAHQFPKTFQHTTQDTHREDYRQFVLKTVEFLAIQLRKRFPETRILLTPGNNDEECGNYSVRAGGLFLHDTADVVRQLARADQAFTASWEALGSFDVSNPAIPGARIISINTVFFSAKYHAAKFDQGCATVPSEGPNDLFTWLESRLSQAQRAHEKVWLMFHIPPGMDGYSTIEQFLSMRKGESGETPAALCPSALVPMWAPDWTAKFDTLLEKYQGTVIASFAGHTHTDDFRVINSSGNTPAFVLINPAISPIYNENPAFRVVSFRRNASIVDTSVYFMTNLLYASATTPGDWEREYTFSRQWKLSAVNAANLLAIYNKVQSSETDRAEWLKLYNVSSSAAYLPSGTTPGLYCAIEALDPEQYKNCYCPGAGVAGTPAPATGSTVK